MTQDKKFKKAVRARMKETGETYMQARRALGGDDRAPQKLRRVGYWRSEAHPGWPDPLDMVDASWDADERAKVLQHLRRGHVLLRSLLDQPCLLGCSPSLGGRRAFFEARGVDDERLSPEERRAARKRAARLSEEANMTGNPIAGAGRSHLTDGVYVWPEGLAHYVELHNVHLPQEFVDHVLENPLPEPPEGTYVHPYMALADRKLWEDGWWRGQARLHELLAKPSVLDRGVDAIWQAVRDMWIEIWDPKTGWHIYEDAPEDGRVHTSLCGEATTKRWETKTPGGFHCETCQLLKVQQILERQKDPDNPLHVLHDPEKWAAAGGSEDDRLKLRDETWGEPPFSGRSLPRVVEVEVPFSPGHYWNDAEYPEEGSVGPYRSREDAEQAARLAEYDPTDPDSVTFFEQENFATVVQRYMAEHIQQEVWKTARRMAGRVSTQEMRDGMMRALGERLSAAVEKFRKEGVLTPAEDDFDFRAVSAEGDTLRGRIWFRDPERYPQLVRALQDEGLIEPRYQISVKMDER